MYFLPLVGTFYSWSYVFGSNLSLVNPKYLNLENIVQSIIQNMANNLQAIAYFSIKNYCWIILILQRFRLFSHILTSPDQRSLSQSTIQSHSGCSTSLLFLQYNRGFHHHSHHCRVVSPFCGGCQYHPLAGRGLLCAFSWHSKPDTASGNNKYSHTLLNIQKLCIFITMKTTESRDNFKQSLGPRVYQQTLLLR